MIRIITVAVLGATLATVAVCQEPEPVPSVLIITMDTTRADHLGCYGAEDAATPNLDRLATRGVLFENAISPAPLTLPSHASIFSGLVPRRHGARDNLNFTVDPGVPLLADRLSRAGWSTGAWVGSVVLDRSAGLARGFSIYDDTVRIGERTAFDYKERAASQVVDAVLEDLPDIKPPFFLWVHLFDPHLPYVPPQPYRSRFKDSPYDGEIAFMDHEIGRLLAAVEAKAGPLVVAVAGDHGESLGEHGEDSHGVFIYQSTQHVPLILAGHGVPAGRKVAERVGLVDLAPTLLELLDLPPLPGADGRSTTSLFRGSPASPVSWKAAYELESMYGRYAYGWEPPRALVKDGAKYIDLPRPELYDLDAAPLETADLLHPTDGGKPTGKVPRTARKLRSTLAARLGQDQGGEPDPADIDPERRAALESLGYLGGSGSADRDPDRPLIDPKDGIQWVQDLATGRRMCNSGKPEPGIDALRRLLARNPDNVPALLTLAGCNLALQRPEQAANACLMARDLAPEDSLVWFNLANARAMQGQNAKATEAYEQSLRLQPRFADAYLNYASFLMRSGDDPGAAKLLRRARDNGVQDPDVEAELGVLLLKTGDVEGAMAGFRRALELNPHAEGPRRALEMLRNK
jgi:choline-sulfatase